MLSQYITSLSPSQLENADFKPIKFIHVQATDLRLLLLRHNVLKDNIPPTLGIFRLHPRGFGTAISPPQAHPPRYFQPSSGRMTIRCLLKYLLFPMRPSQKPPTTASQARQRYRLLRLLGLYAEYTDRAIADISRGCTTGPDEQLEFRALDFYRCENSLAKRRRLGTSSLQLGWSLPNNLLVREHLDYLRAHYNTMGWTQ